MYGAQSWDLMAGTVYLCHLTGNDSKSHVITYEEGFDNTAGTLWKIEIWLIHI